MIELVIKNFLNENFKNVKCFLELPENMPNEFVVFEKTSSSEKFGLYSSTFAFQSYSKSLYETAKLNKRIKKIIKKLVELDEIVSVSLNSNYNFTDSELKRYRYQSVFDIKHY